MLSFTTVFANLEMLIATIIWGSTFLVAKRCLADVNVVTLICYRFILAAVVAGVILVGWRKQPWRYWKAGLLLGVLLFIFYLLQTASLYDLSVAHSGFINGLFVIFVPLLNIILGKERLHLNLVAGVVIVALGLWSITGGIGNFGRGDLFALLSALVFACYIIYVDRVVKSCDIWILLFQQFLVIGVMGLFTVLILDLPLTVASLRTEVGIVYLGLLAGVLAYVLQLHVQKFITPLTCAMLLALEPVFAAIFAWTIGGERVTVRGIVGGILITAAIVYSQLPKVRKAAPVEVKVLQE